jgi:AcrR family transcriptional regulator
VGRPKLRNASLRTEMCAAALRLLDGGGAPAVTTRAVAGATGSSIAAVDELFGGKPGLVRAIHAEGFRKLAGELACLPDATTPERAILDLAGAVRSFALRHRHLYEVMFSRPFAEFSPDHEDQRAAEAIYRIVLSRVVALLNPVRPSGAGKDAAITLLATIQGLVGLELAGILGSSSASVERRWRAAITAAIRGVRAADPT